MKGCMLILNPTNLWGADAYLHSSTACESLRRYLEPTSAKHLSNPPNSVACAVDQKNFALSRPNFRTPFPFDASGIRSLAPNIRSGITRLLTPLTSNGGVRLSKRTNRVHPQFSHASCYSSPRICNLGDTDT